MTEPLLLDLFCCEGGASVGYERAGFNPRGVDVDKREAYPFPFHQGSAIDVMRMLNAGLAVDFGHPDGTVEWLMLSDFAAGHGSPPCQFASTITPDSSRDKHPNLIPATREQFIASGLPYIIENVEGAKSHLIDPVKLCGSSFNLAVRRHRYFESNVWLTSIPCDHETQGRPIGVYGDHPQDDEYYTRPDGTKRGNKAKSLDEAREAMGMPWATWRGVTEAIPPVFTEWLGHQLIESLEMAA